MTTVTEGTFEIGGASLYTRTWTPGGHIRAKIVFVHGFSDHINWYNDFFAMVAEQGIQVFGFDQRGWGRSVKTAADRGNTGLAAQVLGEVAAFVQSKLPSTEPVFVMGHSMGGGEVLALAAGAAHVELVGQVRGWILESPLIGFPPATTPSTIKVVLGRLASRLVPRHQLKSTIPPEDLTRDPAVVEKLRADTLCHDMGTLEGLAAMLDRTNALGGGEMNLPAGRVRSLLLAHGDTDLTTSCEAAVKYMDEQQHVEDKTTKIYKGGYHQLHTDWCKEEFARDLVEWVLARADSAPVEAKL